MPKKEGERERSIVTITAFSLIPVSAAFHAFQGNVYIAALYWQGPQFAGRTCYFIQRCSCMQKSQPKLVCRVASVMAPED